MRRGEEKDPLHERQGLEEEVFLEFAQDLGLTDDLGESAVGIEMPELVAAVDRHGVREQAPHAVADQHHFFERRVAPLGVVHQPRLLKRVPEAGGGDRERNAGWIHVEHELEPVLDHGIAEQVVDHRNPSERAGGEAVDHHDGDFARLVGTQEHEIRAVERGTGAEQAVPLKSVEVGA